MQKLMLIAIALFGIGLLFAQGFTISTPEGNISMNITGVQADGKTNSGTLIDNIVARLEQLQKEHHVKLNKVDQIRAKKLVDEIYELLALLPMDANVSVTSAPTAQPSSQPNISINITSPPADTKPAPTVKPSTEKPKHEAITTPGRKLMPDKDFNDLMARINKESFADNKLRVLNTAAKNSRFNVSQIVRLIGAFTFAEDKLNALSVAYPECQDPHNNYKILEAFTFASDKEDAEEIINSY
ncbi:MAG: DUF4476 domain-containing protein [Candidatus Cloacimonadaceae bacterium]|nr:DUF4476 domain-containing protein [Candidatus Cloacimonadaceae bacterium]